MFGKSHEKKAGDHAAAAMAEARKAAKQRLGDSDGLRAAEDQAAHLREAVVEKAGVAGEKFQHGVDAVAPKVEAARETFVDEIMPKVTEAVAAITATALAAKDSAKAGAEQAREQAAVRLQDYVDDAPQGLVDAIPGVEKRPRKGGKLLIALGLAAAGAAVYAFLNAKKAKEDPWSTPRYDSASGSGAGWQSPGTTGAESKTDAAKEKVAAAGAAVAAKAGDVKDAVADKVEDLRPTDAEGHAKDAADSAGDAAGDVWDDVRGKDAGDKLGDAADSVGDGDLGDAADSAGDAAKDAFDDVRGKDAGDKLGDAADSAGDAASDAWTDAKRWADDATDDASKKG